MKRLSKIILVGAVLLLFFTSCVKSGNPTKESKAESASVEPVQEFAVNRIPERLYGIPHDYFDPSDCPGTLVEFFYDTYEAFSYEQKTIPLKKRALIYLPFGYSKKEQYDVLYLMHGGWSNETITLGLPGEESTFKNLIDHAIENGEIKPLIIVCPTFNNLNENGQDSNDFVKQFLLTEIYHQELIQDLIPAVEGEFSAFSKGTTPAELMAARDHRGFGGFSMGGAATWRTFQHGMDYFRYYMPSSVGVSLNDEEIWQGAEGHPPLDYFVYIMTGSADFAYSYEENRVTRMRESPYFIESDNVEDGNFAFMVQQDFQHDAQAAMVYFYNGMRFFWGPQLPIVMEPPLPPPPLPPPPLLPPPALESEPEL